MAKFKIKQNRSGFYYWELYAPNGQVIAKSDIDYNSIPAAENAICAVKKYAETAEVNKPEKLKS